ncbi:MAG: helix-turn-helix domain-containing protein [Planctomycetes bacterium]|jgi:XRE family aerobic/anaerobic benzoate catabolism transcriptional regulator|nr:helix-turn-helix domain-containing protein [Planctomycetota bacterium]MBT4027983.1 helix-turn-helix domain-containing protein [Planctomycetota bacterium]MBT4561127.1 helix-turn-helix domain-containing protein [Planctomycetota bacterium]MBT5119848.1 helix-turn-helix domain-containing protein [Planctomycetota bacterium]MBT7011937.1 helix-turn-helix domain-containing protein [Planctomycetota bacterium]
MKKPPTRILETLGAKVRQSRHARGLSLQDLATRADFSRRFLVEIEAGRTNPSIGKLAAIAEALCVPLRELCDIPTACAPFNRIALIGMRGAGKTAIGKAIAQTLKAPFVELGDLIQEKAGISVPEIFSLEGIEGYHRLEAQALEDWLGKNGTGVLATPGGIVHSPDSFERLLHTCRTVWLQASPQEHWNRVVAQGDTRPMGSDPGAMNQLAHLLEERTPLYRRAELHFNTSGRAIEDCAIELNNILHATARKPWQ